MIRFGIAGFGLHAVRRLMPGFALARNCKVVALSRRDSHKAREAAAQYSIPHVFASTEELCRCSEVDAVLVATPNVCHLQDVLTAVAAASRCCARNRWAWMRRMPTDGRSDAQQPAFFSASPRSSALQKARRDFANASPLVTSGSRSSRGRSSRIAGQAMPVHGFTTAR